MFSFCLFVKIFSVVCSLAFVFLFSNFEILVFVIYFIFLPGSSPPSVSLPGNPTITTTSPRAFLSAQEMLTTNKGQNGGQVGVCDKFFILYVCFDCFTLIIFFVFNLFFPRRSPPLPNPTKTRMVRHRPSTLSKNPFFRS